MAAPAYTSDVTSQELDTAEAVTNWTAIGTGAISLETDFLIQGSGCISKVGWTAATRGAIANSGSDRAAQFGASYKAFLAWVEYHNPNLLDVVANGGIQLIIGSGTGAYRQWYVAGSAQIPYGGWHCFAVDPANVAQDTSTGAPTGVRQYFGALCKVLGSGSLKGNPFGIDVIRIGRENQAVGGDQANGYATLAGLEAYGNASSRRWGLLYLREGAYYMQGCLTMGLAATAVDWRDSDRSILILDTPKVHANFNAIEIRNASSRVDWTRYTVQALGTVSKGYLTVVDNADVNFDSCSFIDMGPFGLLANTAFLNCNLLRCGQITAPGSDLRGTKVTQPTVAADTGAVLWNVAQNTDSYLDGMVFTKGANAHHAVQFGTSAPTTVTLRGITFSGFNAADGQNDSVLLFPDKGVDTTWTVNCIGTQGTVSYKKARAGDTVNIVINPVTLGVTVKNAATGAVIQGARVYVMAAAGGAMAEGTVIINDVTPAGGRLSDSRTYASDQPLTGWARAASGAPFFKSAQVSGTVDSETGLEVTVLMVYDQ